MWQLLATAPDNVAASVRMSLLRMSLLRMSLLRMSRLLRTMWHNCSAELRDSTGAQRRVEREARIAQTAYLAALADVRLLRACLRIRVVRADRAAYGPGVRACARVSTLRVARHIHVACFR